MTGPDSVPNPGSDAALDRGCLCPVMDNGHGRGSMWGKDVFVITGGCPLHDKAIPAPTLPVASRAKLD